MRSRRRSPDSGWPTSGAYGAAQVTKLSVQGLSRAVPPSVRKTGTSGDKMAHALESARSRSRCASYIGSPCRVTYRALDRHSTSSCARAPLRKPPPGSMPFAKFSASGRLLDWDKRSAAPRVVSFATVEPHLLRPLSRKMSATVCHGMIPNRHTNRRSLRQTCELHLNLTVEATEPYAGTRDPYGATVRVGRALSQPLRRVRLALVLSAFTIPMRQRRSV